MGISHKGKTSRVVIAGLSLILIIGVAEGLAQGGPLGQMLGRMDTYNKNLSSLKADVIMVKTDTGLGISETTKGNTLYLPEAKGRPKYIRINWTEPMQEYILVVGDDYKLYSPRRNLAYEGKTNKAQGNAKAGTAFAFLGMSAAERKANFKSEFVANEILKDGTLTVHVILRPIAKADFKFADVWINAAGLPQQTRITALNNDHTTILLTNVDENKKIEGKLFDLTYKKGTVVKSI